MLQKGKTSLKTGQVRVWRSSANFDLVMDPFLLRLFDLGFCLTLGLHQYHPQFTKW